MFLGDMFDDVVVITGMWMYIFSYDLRLKSRIDMTASESNGKANGIKDLENISANGVETDISSQYQADMDLTQNRKNHIEKYGVHDNIPFS
jgi:hypothetical protein